MRALAVAVFAASLASAQTAKSPTAAKKAAPKAAPAKSSPVKSAAKATPVAPPPAAEVPAQPTGRALPPPKDETAKDKALSAFLTKLKDVLKRKDRDGLLALLAPEIDAGLRTMVGPNAFFTAWGLSDPNSSVYGVLAQILSMPGVMVGEQYCAPYVSAQFPSDLDRSKHQVVLNPNVKVRETNSATAKVVATLSYEIVQVLERGPEWTKVRTQSGIDGYIPIAYLYSPAGYRACLGKNAEGVWQVQSLAVPR